MLASVLKLDTFFDFNTYIYVIHVKILLYCDYETLPSFDSLIAALINISNSSFGRTGTTHFGRPNCSSRRANRVNGKSSSGGCLSADF